VPTYALVPAGGATASAPTTREALELFPHSLCPIDRVVLEVTGNAWEIARILEPQVGETLVVKGAPQKSQTSPARSLFARSGRRSAISWMTICAVLSIHRAALSASSN
jgi:hypothetical protein